MTMRDAFTTTMSELLTGQSRTAVVTADIGAGRFDPPEAAERVFNVGIREQAMIGIAAGLALEGLRPFVHSYAPFLVERPFEQIKLDLVHQGLGAVLIGIGGSYDAAREGRTHQAPEDVALLSTLPDVSIHVPGHPDEVVELMRRASHTEGVEYLRLSDAANETPLLADGRIRSVREGGRDARTILAIGPMLDPVLRAVADLDVTVLYASTVAPLDAEGLRRRVGRSLFVVEPYLQGSTIPAIVEALEGLPVRLIALGVERSELRRYGTAAEHQSAHLLDAVGIRRRLDAASGWRRGFVQAAVI